jgi:hypothetical protein
MVLPLAMATDLQDHLLVACHDLDRLQVLLAEASEALMTGFRGALDGLEQAGAEGASTAPALASARASLGGALSALQFQDLTSQLIRHAQSRLRNCADRIAAATLGDDDAEAVVEPPPLAPNPVTQAEMDVGSAELF